MEELSDRTARIQASKGDRLDPDSGWLHRHRLDDPSGGAARPSFLPDRGLRPGELHLWTVSDRPWSIPDLHDPGALLAADEREMAEHFWPARRRQFVAGRMLTRLALSRHCPVRPQEWVFALGRNGRPFVVAPEAYRDVRFSIAHTEGLTACLISGIDEAAVDVEKIRDWQDLPLIAPQVLSVRELSDIKSLSGDAWCARFFDYWTLKEAYTKARGIGLGLDLTKIGFELGAQGEVRVRLAVEVDDDSRRWEFRRLQLGGGYAAAVAIGREDEEDCTLIHRHANFFGNGETAARRRDQSPCQR